jgi:hypothetical protein
MAHLFPSVRALWQASPQQWPPAALDIARAKVVFATKSYNRAQEPAQGVGSSIEGNRAKKFWTNRSGSESSKSADSPIGGLRWRVRLMKPARVAKRLSFLVIAGCSANRQGQIPLGEILLLCRRRRRGGDDH